MNSPDDAIQWTPYSKAPPLATNEVHVWATPLDVARNLLACLATALSSDEKERAGKFKFEKHRDRFIAGRGLLRNILGQYHADPGALRFNYSLNGKPVLAEKFAISRIHFNVAHSDDLLLVALTRIGQIGVDVERIRPVKEMDELVARFFSARETEAFQKISASEKPAAFFNLWTRKEALLKATGEGITRSLSLVEVSFLRGEPARLLAIAGDTGKAAEWTLCELSPVAGFAAALAIQAHAIRLNCGKWVVSL